MNIALAYVPTARAAIGTALAARIRERDVPARVVRTLVSEDGMSTVPEEPRHSKEHAVCVDGDVAVVGITHFAQSAR